MANFIKTILGFDFSKNSVTNVANATVKIKDSIISIGPVIRQLQNNVDRMSNVTYWIGIATAAEKGFGGVRSVVSALTKDFKKIYDFADEYAVKGDKVAKTSRLVGLSVRDYQAFSSVAKDSRMTIEEMDSALKKFNVNLAKARNGDEKSSEMFESLLPKNKNLSDYKTSSELLVAIADGYAKLSSSELKAYASSEIFGKSGLKMSEILSQGGSSLSDFLKTYNKGFSEEGARRAEAFTHELQIMLEEFEEIKISVAQELFPAFKELFGEITSMFRGENGSEMKTVLKNAGVAFKNFVLNLLPRIPKILDTIIKIVDMFTPEVVVGIGLILSAVPALTQILLSVKLLWPFIMKIGGLVKVIAFGTLGVIIAKIGLIVAGAWSVYKIFTEIHENWRMFSEFIEEKLKTATGLEYTLLAGLKSIVGHFEMTYRLVGLIFGDWEEWSEFVRKDLKDVNHILDIIGDCLAGLMFGVYEAFDWTVKKLETLGGYLGKIPVIGKLLGGKLDFNVSSDIGSDFLDSRSTLGASAAQAVQESRTTVTNRFAVDFKNMPRGVVVTPPEHGDFDYSRGYMLGGI